MVGDVYKAMTRAKRDHTLPNKKRRAKPSLVTQGGMIELEPDSAATGSQDRETDSTDAKLLTHITASTPPVSVLPTSRKDGPRSSAHRAGQVKGPQRVGREEPIGLYAKQVIAHHDPGSFIAEQYRAVRTQILSRQGARGASHAQTMLLTSAALHEGKTITTLNLAMTFGELGEKRILAVEANLNSGAFARLMGNTPAKGLRQWLSGDETDLDKLIQPTVRDNVQWIGSGGPGSKGETILLAEPPLKMFFEQLRDRYDYILVDTPSLDWGPQATVIGAHIDQAILVVRLHCTPQPAVERAKRLLSAAKCNVAGVVVTRC